MLLFSSCSLYKEYESSATVQNNVMGDIVNSNDTMSIGDLDWQTIFKDPQLQQLINTALANNTDMRTAQFSIEQAQNEVKAARWGYAPTLAFAPQATYTYQGGVNSLNLSLSPSLQAGSWESLDKPPRKSERPKRKSPILKTTSRLCKSTWRQMLPTSITACRCLTASWRLPSRRKGYGKSL